MNRIHRKPQIDKKEAMCFECMLDQQPNSIWQKKQRSL